MTKTRNYTIAIAIALFTISNLSFTTKVSNDTTPAGTYKGGTINGSPIVSLTIHKNNTFKYIDNSVASKPISVKGTWSTKNNKIILNEKGTNNHFHNSWKVDNNQNCLKSRKGLTYYRLCK